MQFVWKLEEKFLIYLTKLVLEAKGSICSTIKGNQLLDCQEVSAFFVVVII